MCSAHRSGTIGKWQNRDAEWAKEKKKEAAHTSGKLNVQFFDSNKLLLLKSLLSLKPNKFHDAQVKMEKNISLRGSRGREIKNNLFFSIYFECYFVFSFRIYSFVMLLADRQTEQDIFASATSVMESQWGGIANERMEMRMKHELFSQFPSISNNWENIPFSPRYNIYILFFFLVCRLAISLFSLLWRLTCDYKSSTEKMQANNFDANSMKKRERPWSEGRGIPRKKVTVTQTNRW